MIQIDRICAALAHVVGWEQSYDPAEAIDADLTQSESGLYFQGAHPLVTLDNMAAVMPDTWGLRYPAWDASRSYSPGDKVSHDDAVWEAVAPSAGSEPQDGNPDWCAYNILSDYLRHITRNGIAEAVTRFVSRKQLGRETRNLVERMTFFDGAGRIRATVRGTHKIVGIEIVPVRSMGVTARIERVGLQMAGATGTVTLYLFHSSQSAPVRTYELEYTARNGSFQWFDLKDCFLPYISGGNGSGGAWYLCYDQDALPYGMEAVNMSKDWSREPCGTCNQGSADAWRELTKYIQASPFMAAPPDGFAETPELWDVADNIYTNTMNYGINCAITVGCDLTDFIISQRQVFQTVIQRQVAATALRTLAMNPSVRVNRNQANATRMDILYELDGNTSGLRPGGLGHELEEAYRALSVDTRGLDRICLGCNNRGVRYRAI